MKTMGPDQPCNRRRKTSERMRRPSADPDGSKRALLRRIRIHPEAQRILGNSIIALVCLERLEDLAGTCPTLHSTALGPTVTLTRVQWPPHRPQPGPALVHSSHQHGFNPNTSDTYQAGTVSPPAQPPGPPDPIPPDHTTPTPWSPEPLHCSVGMVEPEEHSLHKEADSNTPQPLLQSSWDRLATADTTELAPLDQDPDPDLDLDPDPDPDPEPDPDPDPDPES
ncbi:wiskott-Aldrich syndrome protein family member 1-like [Gadus morhua]|uniref:wiskott-Aldrich syndrome protein family member 1-like n=1 Tax=Gadus morhua TaxID=8049 RepID=UPI0011B58564|nr:wiskott-Aldrich syndrome protein family member 1-like [Gadus morhua]